MIAATKQANISSATGALNIENFQKKQSSNNLNNNNNKLTLAQTVGSDKQNAAQFNKNNNKNNNNSSSSINTNNINTNNKCNSLPSVSNHKSSEIKCEKKGVAISDAGIKQQAHMQRSKVSCSPQAAAALTNTIAGPSAASNKIQHRQQKFLAAAAKCHQSASLNLQTAIKDQRKFETNPKALKDVAWRSPLISLKSTTTTNNDSEARIAASTVSGLQRQNNATEVCCPTKPLLSSAPTLSCCCCCPTKPQPCLQATPTVSAKDNNATSQPTTNVPNDEQQQQVMGKRAQQQPSAVKPLSTKNNARSKTSSSSTTAISTDNCASDCGGDIASITNKSAKLACCASVASTASKTINHKTVGNCFGTVINNVEPTIGQQSQHQDQVRRVGENYSGYISSGASHIRSNNYHQHQYYYHHPNNSINNINNYHQPQHYLNSYNHHYHHHQNPQMATQAQPAPQVMAHYKFHNDDQSSVLTYDQVKRLDHVMDQVVPIHGRGNSPTLFVKLKELIRLVKHKLQNEHSIEIRDVRLNGGASLYVLAPENSHYNDLDLIFGIDLSDGDRFDVIRDVVLECLMEFHPDNSAKRYQGGPVVRDDVSKNLSDGCNINNEIDERQNEINDISKYEDYATSEQASRSDRSLSFESDNLNITINDSEIERSDVDDEGEDDVMVKIEDSGVELSSSSSSTTEKTSEYDSEKSQDVKERGCQFSSDGQSRQAYLANIAASCTGYDINSYYQRNNLSQHQYLQMPPNNCAIKEAYVHKMVKVNDDDRWSLISLGVQQSEGTNCCGQTSEQTTVNNCGGMVTYAPINNNRYNSNANNNCDGGYMSQQKQFPNSIELKFVDRMRRKFEFSVDSFQIILDSLIQFYDFAPQSTITIQKKLASSNLSSTTIDTARPIETSERCSRCSSENRILFDHTTILNGDCNSTTTSQIVNKSNHQKIQAVKNLNSGSANINSNTKISHQLKNRKASISGARGLYELSLDQGGQLISNSSVASSSGCSSSSSVVSSSSSSLSCDEDQEDLYCENDNSPSSSASTSSFMSSTTASIISSAENSSNHANSRQDNNVQLQRKVPLNNKQTKSSKINSNANMALDGTLAKSTAKSATQTIDKKVNINDCTECFDKNHHNSCLDCNSSMRQCNSLIRKNLCDYGTNGTSCAVISENFYPTVIGRSEYGNFKEALYHLEKKLIATRSPEEIRGGGLLKYCNLLVKNYKPTNVYQIRTLERYMCSRFFIDFSDLNQQRAKLESYLANHFSDDPIQKFDYLTILHTVVQRSTVCLMNHELRLTLNMIRELAYNLNEQQIQQRQQHAQVQDHHHLQQQTQQQQQQQQQSRPAQLQVSSSNQAAHEQHYYQPYLAKGQSNLGNSASSNAGNLLKT